MRLIVLAAVIVAIVLWLGATFYLTLHGRLW